MRLLIHEEEEMFPGASSTVDPLKFSYCFPVNNSSSGITTKNLDPLGIEICDMLPDNPNPKQSLEGEIE